MNFMISIGTIHVARDCGSSLGVVYGEDSCIKSDNTGKEQNYPAKKQEPVDSISQSENHSNRNSSTSSSISIS